MGDFFPGIEGYPLTSSTDSYVAPTGKSAFFVEDGYRTMAFVGHQAYCGKCKGVSGVIGRSACFEGDRLAHETKGRAKAKAADFVRCTCDKGSFTMTRHGKGWVIKDSSSPCVQAKSTSKKSSGHRTVPDFNEMMVVATDDRERSPVADLHFRIKLEDGSVLEGTTNKAGETKRIHTNGAVKIEIEPLI